jgi:PAS domain S-box-containing protein
MFIDKLTDKVHLKTALIVPFFALTVIAVGLVGYISFLNGQKAVNNVAHHLREEISKRIESHLYNFLNTAQQINQLNASDMKDGSLDVTNQKIMGLHFWKQIQTFKNVTSVYFGNTDGGLVNSGREVKTGSRYIISTDDFKSGPFKKFSTDKTGNIDGLVGIVQNFDARTRKWYTNAVENRSNIWNPVYILFTGDDMAIASSTPVYNNNNKLLGVTSVDLFLSHISRFLKSLTIGKKGSAFLIEHSGLMIGTSTGEKLFTSSGVEKKPRRLNITESKSSLIRHAAESLIRKFGNYHAIRKERLSFEADGDRFFLNVSPIKDDYGLDWLIVVVVPESDFMEVIEANKLVTFLFIIGTLLFVILIGFFMAQRIANPVFRINEAALNLAKGQWNQKIQDSGMFIEIKLLARSFNQMADQMQQMLENLNSEIGERKRAEEELKAHSDFTDRIIENSAHSLWISDSKGTAIKTNPACLKLFGATKDEIINKYNLFQDVVIEQKGFMPLIRNVFEKGEIADIIIDYDFAEVDHVDVENATHTIINSIFTPITDSDGTVTNVIVQAIDLSEIRRAEEQLRNIDTIFKALLENSPIYIFFKDKKIRPIYLSKNYEKMLGMPLDKVLGKTMDDLFPSDLAKSMIADDKKILKEGKLIQIKEEMNGRYYTTIKFPITIPDKDPILAGFTIDVTEEKRVQEEKEKLNQQILQSHKMESIGILAGGIAHDFNNILGVIAGNVSHALSKLTPEDELFEILSEVEEGSAQSEKLIQQLLTFAKGGAPIKKAADINPKIQETAKFVTSGANSRCEFNLSKDLLRVDVDEGQLNQVVNNIVINANHSMPKGGVIKIGTENIEMRGESIIPLPDGEYVKITVEDQGHGIPVDEISKIFDPFYTTKEKGSGLGLSTSYSIIKRHGGHINVYSEINKGTVFSIYLPATLKSIEKRKKKKDVPLKGSGKILIMDDQKPILKMAGRMLETMGYETLTAEDGEVAVEIYRDAFSSDEHIDLVIVDLTIPGGMGGAETLTELLKIDSNAQVVVSSGYSNDPIMANFEEYGFCGVVSKPYTMTQLSEALNKILGRDD